MVTILITTYNRSTFLKIVLDTLLKQQGLSEYLFEVVIVDNNSTDATKKTVENYTDKFQGRLRYLFVGQQGKSIALNTAIEHAKGEYIAFLDDDVKVDPTWLKTLFKLIKDCPFDAVGGRVIPEYNLDTPQWVKDNQKILIGPIVCHDYDLETIECTKDIAAFLGANMVIKKEMFKKFGAFRTDLGPGSGRMGEDTEYYRRLQKANCRLFYCGSLIVSHPVEKYRCTLKYIAKWCIASGKHLVHKDYGAKENHLVYYFGIPRYLLRSFPQHGFLLIPTFFNKQNFLKHWIEFFREYGMIQEYISLNNTREKV